jgi:hypothetical protein
MVLGVGPIVGAVSRTGTLTENTWSDASRRVSGAAGSEGKLESCVTTLVHLEACGPLAGGVKNAKDFNGICANSIGNDEGCVANDQLART